MRGSGWYHIKESEHQDWIPMYWDQDIAIWTKYDYTDQQWFQINETRILSPDEEKDYKEELKDFIFEMGEDYHLWDEEDQGKAYPVERMLDAMSGKFQELTATPKTECRHAYVIDSSVSTTYEICCKCGDKRIMTINC